MPPRDVRKDLISYVRDRVNNIVCDVNTYTWAKVRAPKSFDKQHGHLMVGIGGGNILSGLGLLVAICYMSKLYWLLEGKPNLIRASEKEAETFAYLLAAYDPNNFLGLESERTAKRMFEIARHKTAHLIAPGGATAVKTVTMCSCGVTDYKKLGVQTYTKFLEFIDNDSSPSFGTAEHGNFTCQVERLARDASRISVWLCQRIEHVYDEKKVADTLVWLEDQLAQ